MMSAGVIQLVALPTDPTAEMIEPVTTPAASRTNEIPSVERVRLNPHPRSVRKFSGLVSGGLATPATPQLETANPLASRCGARGCRLVVFAAKASDHDRETYHLLANANQLSGTHEGGG